MDEVTTSRLGSGSLDLHPSASAAMDELHEKPDSSIACPSPATCLLRFYSRLRTVPNIRREQPKDLQF